MSKIRVALGQGAIVAGAMPIFLLLVSGVMGAILATIEDWSVEDGLLYVGGNLVLIPLIDVLPTTMVGIIADFVISVVSLGILGWLLAVVGVLPFCNNTLKTVNRTAKSKHPLVVSFVPAAVLLLALLPLVVGLVSLAVSVPLSFAEDWTYEDSFLRAFGTLTHNPSLAPKVSHPMTVGGKICVLLLAFLAVGIMIGWTVGVFILLPAMDGLVAGLGRLRCRQTQGFLAKAVTFVTVIVVVVPAVFLPLAFVFGALLSNLEGWESSTTGMLYVAGNIVLIPLTPVVAKTTGGKILATVLSCVSTGGFGFVVALVGALPFVDTCCDALGGKREGSWPALRFIGFFFLVLMPFVCAVVALPLGGLLIVFEDWSFIDAWLSALSVLSQAPSLAPPGLHAKSDLGKIVIYLNACYALCVTIGWGAGMIVASAGLDAAGKRLHKAIGVIEEDVEEGDKTIEEEVADAAGSLDIEAHTADSTALANASNTNEVKQPSMEKAPIGHPIAYAPSTTESDYPIAYGTAATENRYPNATEIKDTCIQVENVHNSLGYMTKAPNFEESIEYADHIDRPGNARPMPAPQYDTRSLPVAAVAGESHDLAELKVHKGSDERVAFSPRTKVDNSGYCNSGVFCFAPGLRGCGVLGTDEDWSRPGD